MHEQQAETCQFDYTSLVEMAGPDSRRFMRFRRGVIWKVRRYYWYLSVLGVREFNRKILPSTRIGRFLTGERESSTKPKSTTSNPPQIIHANAEDSQRITGSALSGEVDEPLNLKAGDWVEVKSAKEIFATLDDRNKHRGLTFSQEMMKYCGERFRVFRVLDKICMETTGELRRMKRPTVILEGVICDGSFHGGCTRSCFHFWRELWLRSCEAPGLEDVKSEKA